MTFDHIRVWTVIGFSLSVSAGWVLAMFGSGYESVIVAHAAWIITVSNTVGAMAALLLTKLLPWPGRAMPRFFIAQLFGCVLITVLWLAVSHYSYFWVYGTHLINVTLEDRTLSFRVLTGLLIFAGLLFAFYLIQVLEQWRLSLKETAAARVALAEARFATLRSHVSPHFLFNSLHAVNALMHVDLAKAEAAMETISALLRRSLEDQRDVLPLHEELAFVEQYLQIQSLRHRDQLRVTRNISSQLADVSVPAFSVQVLVENAVEHGGGSTGFDLNIEARWDGAMAAIEVTDRGEGCDNSALLAKGHALSILNERLMLLYGQGSEIYCRSIDGRFIVGFRVPLRGIAADKRALGA